jgi:hypothetical protein
LDRKTEKHRIPEDFFSFFSGGICSQERGLGGFLGIPVFSHFYRIFLQEFLWDRNSCISPNYSGFLWIPPDSCRIPVPTKTVWLWSADKFSPN